MTFDQVGTALFRDDVKLKPLVKERLRLCGPEGLSEHEWGSAGACGGCTPKWHGAAGGQARRGEQPLKRSGLKGNLPEWSSAGACGGGA